jgi:hypothetical protein
MSKISTLAYSGAAVMHVPSGGMCFVSMTLCMHPHWPRIVTERGFATAFLGYPPELMDLLPYSIS